MSSGIRDGIDRSAMFLQFKRRISRRDLGCAQLFRKLIGTGAHHEAGFHGTGEEKAELYYQAKYDDPILVNFAVELKD
jgi:hypothetical protein